MITNNLKHRILTSLLLVFLVLLIFSFKFILVYTLIALGVLAFLEFTKIISKIFISKLSRFLCNISFGLYIFIFCNIFFLFSILDGVKILLFILLAGCIASDVGGFIFGKIFKGPKLTKISPNKTYSGLVGSIFLTVILVNLLFFYFFQFFQSKIFFTAIITSLMCQTGDLIFSFLKRKAKIKDTGNILPGHGGILDRLDGILLGVPFGLMTFLYIN
jgi:phosphatidate cytidylyltransferase